MTKRCDELLDRLYRKTEEARYRYQLDPNRKNWLAITAADAAWYNAWEVCNSGVTEPPALPCPPSKPTTPEPEPQPPEEIPMENEQCDTSDMGSLLMSNRKLGFDNILSHCDDLNKRALQFLDDAHAFSVKALTDAQSVAQRVANDGATASNRANADAQTESHLISMKSIDNTLTWSNELASVTGSNAGTSQGRQNVNADAIQSQMASLVAAIVPIVVAELKKPK